MLFRRLPRRSDIAMLSRVSSGHSPAGNRSAPAGEIHAPACRLVETSLAGPEGMGGQKRSVGVLRQESIFFPTRLLSKERRPSGARLAL